MQIIRQNAYARAGLIGNPSDGYHGKSISLLIEEYRAQVILYEWEDLELILSQEDRSRFSSIQELAHDVDLHGYYGGVRLVKATIKKFVEYCEAKQIQLDQRNFSVRYESNVPRQVGLAGSSAIIVATLRALMQFYGVQIPRVVLPTLVLRVETDELGIVAGLQDRVIQVYGGLVYMDFSEASMRRMGSLEYGLYEPLEPTLLPPLYVAFSEEVGEPTEVQHGPLRTRWLQGDPEVRGAMEHFARLAAEAKMALLRGDHQRLGQLIDENFDTRDRICDLHPNHRQLVQTARRFGASAKYAGSGGAIVGTYPDEAAYEAMKADLEGPPFHCRVFKPTIKLLDTA
jgi:glucuronokinase